MNRQTQHLVQKGRTNKWTGFTIAHRMWSRDERNANHQHKGDLDS